MRKGAHRKKGAGKRILIALLILILIVGGFLGYRYLKFSRSGQRFPDGTTINGISCGHMTAQEAAEKLSIEWNSKEYHIKQADRNIAMLTKFGADYDIEGKLDKMMEKNWPNFMKYDLLNGYKKAEIPMTVKSFSSKFVRKLKRADFLKNDEVDRVYTKDAYVKLKRPDFPIIKEVYGNDIDYDRFLKRLSSDLESHKFTCEFDIKDYYSLPKLKEDDQEILDKQAYCKKNLSQKIDYQFGKRIESMSEEDMDKIKKADGSGFKIDQEALKDYVLNLAMSNNTWGKTREFVNHSGVKMKISGGDYGYVINQKKEVKQLQKDLESNKDIKREPVFAQRSMFGDIDNDLLDTYVEVDTGKQMLWLLVDGETIVSTSVVTGSSRVGYDTWPGVYALTYKTRNATLRGTNNDGSRYASPVKYWMPFNGNIGLHDAPWKTRFGVEEHRRAPSHGCVNMTAEAAGIVYKYVSAGFPIVVHK